MTVKKTIFIVNPAAAQGALATAWGSLAKGLKGAIRHFDVGFTRGKGDATVLARKALKDGYKMVVAVGGDGTLNECVNGYFHQGTPVNPKALMGIVPFGRGSDLARGLGFSRLPEQSMQHLKGTTCRRLDVGEVQFCDPKGQMKKRYFINCANVGLVSHVVNWSHVSPKFLGSMGAYLYGAVRGALEFKGAPVEIKTSGQAVKTLKLLNMVIANGVYFGAGMKIAPQAKVDDGLFDVLIARNMSLLKFLRHVPDLYSGNHLKLSNVSFLRSDLIDIKPKNKTDKIFVEMDGDTVGTLPAIFKVKPRALLFKV